MNNIIELINERIFKKCPLLQINETDFASENNLFFVKLDESHIEIFVKDENIFHYIFDDDLSIEWISRSILRKCHNNVKYNKNIDLYTKVINLLTDNTYSAEYIIKLLNGSITTKSPIIFDSIYYSTSSDLQYSLNLENECIELHYKGRLIYIIPQDQNWDTFVHDVKKAMIKYCEKQISNFESRIKDIKNFKKEFN